MEGYRKYIKMCQVIAIMNVVAFIWIAITFVSNGTSGPCQDFKVVQTRPEPKEFVSHVPSLSRQECLATLKRRIHSAFVKQIGNAKRAVLVDVPTHDNLGDHFITSGELLLLRDLGLEVSYICPSISFVRTIPPCNMQTVEKFVRDGDIILLQGGGNFGDLWKVVQDGFRKSVLQRFSNIQTILFPQSVTYTDLQNAVNDSFYLNAHTKLKFNVRGSDSLHFSRRYLKLNDVILCPDAAFYNGDLNTLVKGLPPPKFDIVVIWRGDHESREGHGGNLGTVLKNEFTKRNISALVTDWLTLPNWLKHDIPRTSNIKTLTDANLKLGVKVLSLGKIIMTNRLHAVILSVLVGKVHIFSDTAFGKIHEVRSSFFYETPGCDDVSLQAHPVSDLISGVDRAEQLLQTFS